MRFPWIFTQSAPNFYTISCHVDDPWIRTNRRPKDEQSELQALTILTPDTPIGYISMQMSVDATGNICLDNDAKVIKEHSHCT